MKANLWKFFIVALALTSCGDPVTGPQAWEVPLTNAEFVLEPGLFAARSFSVDLAEMQDPGLVGVVVVDEGAVGSINILVMDVANLALWENNETYTAVFESGETQGGNLNVDIPTTGDYALVFSNRADTTSAKFVSAITSLVFLRDNP